MIESETLLPSQNSVFKHNSNTLSRKFILSNEKKDRKTFFNCASVPPAQFDTWSTLSAEWWAERRDCEITFEGHDNLIGWCYQTLSLK